MGVFALLVFLTGEPLATVGFIVALLLFIPIKKSLDKPRKEKIQEQESLD